MVKIVKKLLSLLKSLKIIKKANKYMVLTNYFTVLYYIYKELRDLIGVSLAVAKQDNLILSLGSIYKIITQLCIQLNQTSQEVK